MFRLVLLTLVLGCLLGAAFLATQSAEPVERTQRIWAQAGTAFAAPTPQPVQFPNLPLPAEYLREHCRECLEAPAFAGSSYSHEERQLTIYTNTHDPQQQQAAYRAALRFRGKDWQAQGMNLERPHFEVRKYSTLQWLQVRYLATQIPGWLEEAETGAGSYGGVQVPLKQSASIPQARAFMRSYGVPDEMVGFVQGKGLSSPEYLHPMAEAEIIAPRLVEQGERMPIRLRLLFERSLPFCFPTPLPPWRVVRLDTEEVVRLRAETVIETYRCSEFSIPLTPSGEYLLPESGPLLWDMRGDDGQPLAPGRYVLQMEALYLRPADFLFEVVGPGGKTPLKRAQSLWHGWFY
ncbi:hypothetical protein GCM10017783_00230 [Deinococcus piscis]|uniref:Uncharacterized protein n=1 Tax=Deinococcus piscis TaxID=394230 RepID=A0ABQ3JVY8_9DEIO|nr:hypothetical protein [Deinococcus piscis]GHF92438.1 hypothetical protein GCM10017783_00230 [Deinococcus piscis]